MERYPRFAVSLLTCMIVLLAHRGSVMLREHSTSMIRSTPSDIGLIYRGIERCTAAHWLIPSLFATPLRTLEFDW